MGSGLCDCWVSTNPHHCIPAKFIYDTAITKLQRRTPNVQETIGQIKQAADIGYIPAQIKMAWCYLFGEGVTLDMTKAKEMFEELAEKGNAEAHAVSMSRVSTSGEVKWY